ncbi:MAG: bifunctional diaminohydroxyphosphoribosylaminopyrimidine deaminase/5-amino-6-(5-phosphoribosylamino)uracil reductase RibD [Thermoanaerobacteraceae bacterium]|nr:bifunctional diaminohydroxyphosphoribosylaminopyrimidine deaminase/5-amino-6-(5-phosphoribosylamino)uracil reductase RibD [Thermoanaerobacteraceae bacterium]
MQQNDRDIKYMQRALELAKEAEGWTSPNPLVGAVIVQDGKIVGEGYHQRAGTPHAEVHALRQAGEKARGATVYVTLEPCSHYGRTPPCAKALVEAGVRRVVVAMEDPNPLVAGRGIELLREAGIEVTVGLMEEEAKALNRPFLKYITTKKPLVAAKMAVSLDGKIATKSGSSRWITGEQARLAGRYLRHKYDAILVGIGTVLADNPRLTTRLEGIKTKNPLRIILDSRLRLPLDSHVCDTSQADTWVVTTEDCNRDKKARLEAAGIRVIVQQTRGKVDLEQLLAELGKQEITGVLVEGGAGVHGSFFDKDLVDVVHLYLAPKVIGGDQAPGPVAGVGVEQVAQARRFKMVDVRRYGEDLGITYVKQ